MESTQHDGPFRSQATGHFPKLALAPLYHRYKAAFNGCESDGIIMDPRSGQEQTLTVSPPGRAHELECGRLKSVRAPGW